MARKHAGICWTKEHVDLMRNLGLTVGADVLVFKGKRNKGVRGRLDSLHQTNYGTQVNIRTQDGLVRDYARNIIGTSHGIERFKPRKLVRLQYTGCTGKVIGSDLSNNKVLVQVVCPTCPQDHQYHDYRTLKIVE
jgi:hypothetical protein